MMNNCSIVLWIFVTVFPLSCGSLHLGYGSEKENDLVFQLFTERGYNPLIRPVQEVNDTINIQFSLALSQLINVDEKNQIMKTNVWLQMYWNDYQLRWDTSQFEGIKVIRIPPEHVWTPDIVLFNNADGNYEVSYKSNIVLYHDGNVTWVPPAIYKSSCTIDVEYFPFDEQKCQMKFGSWTFRGDQLSFTWYSGNNYLDFTDYLKSGTWDIIDCPGNITRNKQKTEVVFELTLRRKTLFYTVNLIIPCVLISFVSICVFVLPADAGEKITLCISILLALVVFLLLISKILPPSLKIPLIAKYLLFTFIMNVVAILMTVIIINRNFRTPRTHTMPYWVRIVFLNYLPRIMLMRRPDHDERWKAKEKEPEVKHSADYSEVRRTQTPLINRRQEKLELTEVHHPNCKLNPPPSLSMDYPKTEADTPAKSMKLTPEILRATEAVKFITEHLKSDDQYNTELEDWKYVARVLDRLQLFIFIVVTGFGSIGILVNAPHIFEYVNQDAIIEEIKRRVEENQSGGS